MKSKRWLLNILCLISGRLQAFLRIVGSGKTKISILMYHGIVSNECQNKARNMLECNISRFVFTQQMRYLSENCHVVRLGDVLSGKNLKKGVTNVVITFDDGYRNNYTNAYPVLKRFGFPAIFALATGFVRDHKPLVIDSLEYLINQTDVSSCHVVWREEEHMHYLSNLEGKKKLYLWAVGQIVDGNQEERERFLSYLASVLNVKLDADGIMADEDYAPLNQTDISTLVREGLIEFAAHSDSHCNLTLVDERKLIDEIEVSKRKVEELTGQPCRVFCIPAGRYDERCVAALRKSGFQTIMTSDKFAFNDHVVIGRNCVTVNHDNMHVFTDLIDGFVQKVYHKLLKA